ncbi:type I-E CRISPR-associated protein Cse2/CasB [Afifella sp. H1R]|uniref:type I-E CRISPR-associated protein Cse2/CasB n=1 Tax=Afifella sp. H1R TaxID=2908841 RepID=UPI001F417FFA|nr:type I-E CRISPR-associated protein Cse2/CasB [Afifella sp. H1R]MCF1506011.1 type I-E CRISPR-associated protein Cse2/CasB [Afifella sp. H1R]
MRLSDEGLKAVLAWWHALHPDRDREWNKAGDAAARAELRRCQNLTDALLIEPTHDLIRRVHLAMRSDWPATGSAQTRLMERLALLAALLAGVRPPAQPSRQHFAAALGLKADGHLALEGERPRLSRARFGALLRAGDEPDRFLRATRRALAILGDTPFNVAAFIADVMTFDDRTRRDWTLHYYQPYGLSPLPPAEAAVQDAPETAS